jgi:hypothetical protein
MDSSSLNSKQARVGRWWLLVGLTLCVGVTTADEKIRTPNYPRQIRGTWIPDDVACSSPVNHDSDSLIDIGRNEIGHYEDSSKATRVVQISESPPVWRIDSLLNVGGDGYNDKVSEVFVLIGNKLIIAGSSDFEAYARCN